MAETAHIAINEYRPAGIDDSFSGQAKTEPHHRIGPTVHEYYLVHSILSGKGIFVIRGQEYQLRSGDSFIFPGKWCGMNRMARSRGNIAGSDSADKRQTGFWLRSGSGRMCLSCRATATID